MKDFKINLRKNPKQGNDHEIF